MRVSLVGVGHWFQPGRVLFKGINADLVAGCVYGVVGPSGAGKTTLLSLIAGWYAPREGSVERCGVCHVQWVQQNPYGVAHRTVMDHVALPFIAAGATRCEAEHEGAQLLSRFNLSGHESSEFCELSGGEAQRLMLARGVAAKPDLLLVDEPTAQLDRRTAAEVNAVLAELGGEGRIVVVATHDMQTQSMCGALIDIGAAS